MSLRGLFALVLEAFLLIMALGTDIREFLIAAVCLGGLLVLSFVSVLWAVVFLRFTATTPHTQHVRTNTITITLNVKGLQILPVLCKIKIQPPYNEKTEQSAPLYNAFILNVFKLNRKYDFTLELLHPGHWNLGIKLLRVCDVFGFFVSPLIFTSRKRISEEISVMPKSHTIESFSKSFNAEKVYEGTSRQSYEMGETFDDSRLYRDGDPLRRIHWKQSAKTGKLYTRLFEKPREPKTVVLIDACTAETKDYCDDIYREVAFCLAEYSAKFNAQTVIHLMRGAAPWEFSLQDTELLPKLRNDLSDLQFKKTLSPLAGGDIKRDQFALTDKLYIVTSNPDSSVISMAENSRGSVKTALIIAKGSRSSVRYTAEESDSLAIIENPCEIPEKVGNIL